MRCRFLATACLLVIAPPVLALARAADALPALQVEDLSGQPLSYDPPQSALAILQTWASWCAPCHEAIPFLRELQRQFPRLQLVLINVDTERPKALAALKEIAPNPDGVTLLFDPSGQVLQRLRVPGMPATIVAIRGKAQLIEVGFNDQVRERIRAAVEQALSAR